MDRRRFLMALIGVCLLAALTWAPVTLAGAEWCDTDPLVLVQTPGGATVPVYVTNGALGVEHLPAVLLAAISYTASPTNGGRATLVKMDVVVPDDEFASRFPTRSVASTGPMATGAIYASTTGYSGKVMRLVFKLDVP